MKKQSLIKGTMILGIATIFARFLGIFFRIPIQQLIGDQGMGYYQMSYPLYMTFVALASGIPISMSKLISEFNVSNDVYAIRDVLRETLKLMIPLGMAASFIMLFFSKNIIEILKWDNKSYEAFLVISLAPILVCIMYTFKGFFQGLQNMNNTAISQIIEQVGRVIFGVLGAYILLPKGIEYAAAGAAFGTVAGGLLGSIYLSLKYFRVTKYMPKNKMRRNKKVLRAIIDSAAPISLGAAVGTIMGLIDSIIVPQRLLEAGYSIKESAILYGQLTGKAMTLQNIPLAVSISLCAVLVPVISEVYSMKRMDELERRVEMVFKLAFIIGIPCFLGLYFLAKPIMGLVFLGDTAGYEILRILSLSVPLIIITQITTSLLQSCGRYMMPVYYLIIGCIFKVVISYYLVGQQEVNINGAVIGTIVGYLITAVLNFIEVKKAYSIKFNIYEILIKPMIASVIMIFAVVLVYNNVYNYTISANISCLSSIFAGIIVFSILIVVLKIFSIEDIKGKLIR